MVVGGFRNYRTQLPFAACRRSFEGGIACKTYKTFSLLISLGFLAYPKMKSVLAKQCVTRDGNDPNASAADRGACHRGRCGTAIQHRSKLAPELVLFGILLLVIAGIGFALIPGLPRIERRWRSSATWPIPRSP